MNADLDLIRDFLGKNLRDVYTNSSGTMMAEVREGHRLVRREVANLAACIRRFKGEVAA